MTPLLKRKVSFEEWVVKKRAQPAKVETEDPVIRKGGLTFEEWKKQIDRKARREKKQQRAQKVYNIVLRLFMFGFFMCDRSMLT